MPPPRPGSRNSARWLLAEANDIQPELVGQFNFIDQIVNKIRRGDRFAGDRIGCSGDEAVESNLQWAIVGGASAITQRADPALFAVSDSIASQRDLTALFHELARKFACVTNFDAPALVLYETATNAMRLRHFSGTVSRPVLTHSMSLRPRRIAFRSASNYLPA